MHLMYEDPIREEISMEEKKTKLMAAVVLGRNVMITVLSVTVGIAAYIAKKRR